MSNRTDLGESSHKPGLIELNQIKGAFTFEEGFSRPDWQVIANVIEQRVVGQDGLRAAWIDAATQWVEQLRSDLGGDYQVKQSRQFILLTALSEDANRQVLSFAERVLEQIHDCLGDAAWTDGLGKHVILLFSEEDDYYQYVSFFHRDGTHPATGGCLIQGGGYVHIAAPYEPFGLRRMLAHELTHNCVAHLPLPLWLNEGLAVMCDRSVATAQQPVMDAELKLKHLELWNTENIQEFWSGVSWRRPGDSNELSYSLAEVMVLLLMDYRGDRDAFLKQANWGDAGQTAALDCLGIDLGDLMSTFLGEGNWRPRRKAMVTLWEAWEKGELQENGGSDSIS